MRDVSVVIAAKPLNRAKSRLSLPPDQRRSIMAGMLSTTIEGALDCPRVAGVAVVSTDILVARLARRIGATWVQEKQALGVNQAFDVGRRWVRINHRSSAVVLLVADLACLDPSDLNCAIDEFTVDGDPLMVVDWVGTGTTCLVHAAGSAPPLSFGTGSATRHRALGYRPVLAPVRSLRQDVDTAADLHQQWGSDGPHAYTVSR